MSTSSERVAEEVCGACGLVRGTKALSREFRYSGGEHICWARDPKCLVDAYQALARRVARLEVLEKEVRVFIERTSSIDEKHPAYDFVVMGIPLVRALAALNPPVAPLETHNGEEPSERRPPHPTGEKHVDNVNGKTYDVCICGAVNEPGAARCFNAAHWGNLEKKLTDEVEALKRKKERLEYEFDIVYGSEQARAERAEEVLRQAKTLLLILEGSSADNEVIDSMERRIDECLAKAPPPPVRHG